jgi:hypothetical protein
VHPKINLLSRQGGRGDSSKLELVGKRRTNIDMMMYPMNRKREPTQNKPKPKPKSLINVDGG